MTRSEPIWHPSASRSSPRIYVRQEFVVAGEVAEGRLRCACSGPFELYLNGESVGRGIGPALTAAPVWESFEIGGLLQLGDNLLLAVAGGEGEEDAWFRAEGAFTYAEGTRIELGTGAPWQVLRADAWQVFEEGALSGVYFAAQEEAGWKRGRFRAEEWEDAAVVEGPEPLEWSPRAAAEVEVWAREMVAFGEVSRREPLAFATEPEGMKGCKCVNREALLQLGKLQARVQTRDEERSIYLVLDFGRTLVGLPRLRLRGPQGGVVDLGFARSAERIDRGLRYVSADGRQEWTGHRLEVYRYLVVRLSSWPEMAEIDCLSLVERRVQVPTQGSLQATEELERIWAVGQRTLADCRQEVYFLGQIGAERDWLRALPFALDDFYLTGDCETAAAMIDSAPPPRPEAGRMLDGLAYLLFVESYFRYSGDLERVGKRLEGIEGILEGCAALAEENGWLPLAEGSTTALNAFYAAALEGAEGLFRALRKREEAGVCRQRYERVRKGFRGLWKEEQGLYAERREGGAEFSQWTNGLILYFGLAPETRNERIATRIRGAEVRLASDRLEAFFLAGGLWRAGFGERALGMIEHQWGRLLANGGATWGEKEGRSRATPGPEFLLAVHLLGVTPGMPGYEVVEVRPEPAGLTRAEGRVLTRRGPVGVVWWRDEGRGRFSLNVELTEEGETHLAVPRLGLRFPTIVLNGETVWRNEKVYPNLHVQEVISEAEQVVLVVRRPGRYEVSVE